MHYSNSVTREFSDPCSDRVSSVAQNRMILIRMTRVAVSACRGLSFAARSSDHGSSWRATVEDGRKTRKSKGIVPFFGEWVSGAEPTGEQSYVTWWVALAHPPYRKANACFWDDAKSKPTTMRRKLMSHRKIQPTAPSLTAKIEAKCESRLSSGAMRFLEDGPPAHHRVRAAMNDAWTRMAFFSMPEFGIRQVRTAWPREKYGR